MNDKKVIQISNRELDLIKDFALHNNVSKAKIDMCDKQFVTRCYLDAFTGFLSQKGVTLELQYEADSRLYDYIREDD